MYGMMRTIKKEIEYSFGNGLKTKWRVAPFHFFDYFFKSIGDNSMNKKLTLQQYFIKTILLCISMVICAFGVTLLIKAQLGSDPMSVWVEGLSKVFGISLGAASLGNNLVLLVFALVFALRNIHIGTVMSSLFFGACISLWEPVINNILGSAPTVAFRVIVTIVGVIIVAFGAGFTVSLRLGFGACDCTLFALSEKKGWPYRFLKMGTDAFFAVVGVIFGGVIGFGSVLSMLVTGPLVEIFAKLFDQTLLKTLNLQDERNLFVKTVPVEELEEELQVL